MKINKSLLLIALLNITAISLCSSQSKTHKETAALVHSANQESEFSGEDFVIPDTISNDDILQTATFNYFKTKIQNEIDKLKKPAHKQNIQQTINATYNKLERSQAIKKKFYAAYNRINAKVLQELTDEEKETARDLAFNDRLDNAKSALEGEHISQCSIQ